MGTRTAGGTLEVDGYRPFPNLVWRNAIQTRFEIPAILRLLGMPHDARILEVGCGPGVAIPELARRLRPRRLVGIDVDAGLLESARAAGVPAELVWGDVRAMPFEDAAFDAVIDFGTCYHVARPEHALREIARVLCDGGVFVHESPVAQLTAHPLRTRGRSLPWWATPELPRVAIAGFWSKRVKRSKG
jgi:ubiquinone/menaquinone biosynthesis C-methylase UbiE